MKSSNEDLIQATDELHIHTHTHTQTNTHSPWMRMVTRFIGQLLSQTSVWRLYLKKWDMGRLDMLTCVTTRAVAQQHQDRHTFNSRGDEFDQLITGH